jgi:hypothetical protein
MAHDVLAPAHDESMIWQCSADHSGSHIEEKQLPGDSHFDTKAPKEDGRW